ncbi:MAG: T9SS type A sorting domain-containing protein, partial [Flavobacteriaceae bacterium]|nr:T9SS type A sorting domain-containing protein [Flavobacteriaceae bacterium]
NAKGLKKLVATNNFLQELHTESNLGLEHTNLMFNLLERLDFSNNANLKTLIVSHNQLQGLNIQNGNNANMQVFQAENNAELSCITADNTVVQAGATNQRWNKDGAASFALSCAGKEYVDNGAFETYLDDSKTLKFTSPTSGTALIYTLGGMPVVKSAVSKGSQEFNLSKLNEAIYILSIVGLDGSFTKKIMIP